MMARAIDTDEMPFGNLGATSARSRRQTLRWMAASRTMPDARDRFAAGLELRLDQSHEACARTGKREGGRQRQFKRDEARHRQTMKSRLFRQVRRRRSRALSPPRAVTRGHRAMKAGAGHDRHRWQSHARAPRSSSNWVKPPVEAPISRASRPETSMPK